jgi:hypothetical protein
MAERVVLWIDETMAMPRARRGAAIKGIEKIGDFGFVLQRPQP